MEMEAAYVSGLMVISLLYMVAVFCVIQITGLSNSVYPPVYHLFKCFFLLFTFYSTTRGWLVNSLSFSISPQLVVLEPAARKYLVDDTAVKFCHLVLFLFACSSLAIRHLFPIGIYISVTPLALFLVYQRCFHSHWMKLLSGVLDSSSLDPFTTWLQIYMSAHRKTNFLLPLSTKAAAIGQEIRNNKKIVKIIKFAVGTTGSVLFQNCFKLNSFEEALAFLYFAVAWLANLTLLSVKDDFGVLDFILGNVIVGSTVAEGGLGAQTWLAITASVLLYSLRLMSESMPSIRGRFTYIRVNIVIFILFNISYYGFYLVLFVYQTHILSDSRPLFDR